ncbi:MAG: T9SS type A sorting domain-containing protein [Ignavibacteriaceae bacterium]
MNPFAKNKNFPNPFNLSTTIIYFVSKPQQVEISIFDILGSKVLTLFKDSVSAGENQVSWDGKNSKGEVVNSGIYLYRVNSVEGSLIGKMVLNK